MTNSTMALSYLDCVKLLEPIYNENTAVGTKLNPTVQGIFKSNNPLDLVRSGFSNTACLADSSCLMSVDELKTITDLTNQTDDLSYCTNINFPDRWKEENYQNLLITCYNIVQGNNTINQNSSVPTDISSMVQTIVNCTEKHSEVLTDPAFRDDVAHSFQAGLDFFKKKVPTMLYDAWNNKLYKPRTANTNLNLPTTADNIGNNSTRTRPPTENVSSGDVYSIVQPTSSTPNDQHERSAANTNSNNPTTADTTREENDPDETSRARGTDQHESPPENVGDDVGLPVQPTLTPNDQYERPTRTRLFDPTFMGGHPPTENVSSGDVCSIVQPTSTPNDQHERSAANTNSNNPTTADTTREENDPDETSRPRGIDQHEPPTDNTGSNNPMTNSSSISPISTPTNTTNTTGVEEFGFFLVLGKVLIIYHTCLMVISIWKNMLNFQPTRRAISSWKNMFNFQATPRKCVYHTGNDPCVRCQHVRSRPLRFGINHESLLF